MLIYSPTPDGVDRSKPVPLFHQVKESLRERIETREWPPGARLPSEKELAAQYGVSQITVRQALARLAMEGLIERQQGKGTFVAQPFLAQEILDLVGFSAALADRGVEVETHLLGTVVTAPTAAVARRLLLADPDSRVIEVRRVRLARGDPICLQTSYLPYSLCRQVLDHDLSRESLFKVLAEVCKLDLARAEESLHAIAVDEYEGRILSVAPGTPAFLVRRTTFDRQGVPVEYAKSVLRGDRCHFVVTLGKKLAGKGVTGTPRVDITARLS